MQRFQGPRLPLCGLAVLTEPWWGDSTLPYPTCEALTCSIGVLLSNGSLCGLNFASWTKGESCAVTYVEGCQAAKETSCTLTSVYNEVAGDVVLEVVRTEVLVGGLFS